MRLSARSWQRKRASPTRPTDPLPMDSVDEVLLMMAWFRAHPDALRRTTPYEAVDVGDWKRGSGEGGEK